ncbi:phytoene desaturase family protein [Rhodobium orientis]|uniref:Phytoene dehydrogenase n=1 Tax=Rhodobium orientis TaxID=34017 RepID=A0A327JP04_9HYPH|nr:phytoene desaturase family protein [Rhodobium orientis]MBK5951605.1 phytoene dehydrogenase [Rhodobium orientis]RAI27811.1 phytoene dehydrogenase [Rhodobium orientis]
MMTHAVLPSDLTDAPARRPHAVVIGAGFGGLAAAVRLGARGYRVTVFDRLDGPGGRGSVWRQDGFTFDMGPTIVTAPFLFEELWELCGRKLSDDIELKALEPFYTVRFDDGETFSAYSDPEKMRQEVARFNPDDVAGYDRYMKEAQACFETGFEGMVDKPFCRLFNMVEALPDLIRRRADRSVYGLCAKYVKDERLRVALSFHPLFIGGSPFRVSAVFSLISYLERHWGVHYAMGGTGALAKGIAGLIEGQGNVVRYNTDVAEIVVEDGKAAGVKLADGEIVAADVVVSNADAAWTYSKLVPPNHRTRWTDAKLDRMAYSMSLFIWYFGTDRKYDDVGHHTILMGPRYRGLIKDIFKNKVLADDFSLYLHRPSATDPSVAPDGCDAFYVLSPVPNLDADIDWTTTAEVLRKRIADKLEATVLPDLSRHIVSSKMITPLDFRDRLLSVKGAAFGMEPTLFQIAWFRPHNVSEELENLYIVGAGTHPGAGLPGVLASARILDKLVPNAVA